jgi:hypothetical protein
MYMEVCNHRASRGSGNIAIVGETTVPGISTLGRPPIVVRQLHVVFRPKRGAPAEIRLVDDMGRLVLGRDPGEEGVRLDDDQASRKHAELRWDAETAGWAIADLSSRNGTIVNGRRVGAARLFPGTVIRIGRTGTGKEPVAVGKAESRPVDVRVVAGAAT